MSKKTQKIKETKKKKIKKAVAKATNLKKIKKPKTLRQTQDKTYTLRSEATGDKVFLIKGGKRFWIMNPYTLSQLGFRLGQERNVSFEELKKFPEEKPMDLSEGKVEKKVEEVDKSSLTNKVEKGKEKIKSEEIQNKPYKVWS